MVNFECNNQKYEGELRDIIRMYIPFFDMNLDVSLVARDGRCNVTVDGRDFCYAYDTDTAEKQHIKDLKKFLYLSMRQYFGRELPWGSLTGIRPTKIAYAFMQSGGDRQDIADMLVRDYYVTHEKAQLVQDIVAHQQDYLYAGGSTDCGEDSLVNLYVHIPFCPTRCNYCSFVSLPVAGNQPLIEQYLGLLIQEITATKQLLQNCGKRVLSAYIGGGTPTVLDAAQLDRLLRAIALENVEFTLEAGRPDTVTREKLAVCAQHGVTRICINPQTFCDTTLSRIGRSHSAADIAAAMELAREFDFAVNMDLIAGLTGETQTDFQFSLDCALKMQPENITIHTLSVKNGSKIGEKIIGSLNSQTATVQAQAKAKEVQGVLVQKSQVTAGMMNFAHKRLAGAGYLPYYLYRQKNMADNLENVGFCKPNCQSINNITTMEETVSVWGCGAGAISKKVTGSLIRRHPNFRDVKLYIDNFEKRLQDKLDFLRD